MIFLDANAVYSYFGRKELGMSSTPVDETVLREFLDSKSDKCIPTSVYIEIVTHFRNNPELLKKIIEFTKIKKLPLYNNIPDYVINEDEITCVGLMTTEHLSEYAYKLLHKKIEIESKFTLLFFEITKNLYTHYKLEAENQLSDYNKESILKYIGKKGFKDYGGILKEKIKAELESGYVDNKEQKVLKDFYIQELNEWCIFADIIVAGCVACKDEQTDIISTIQNIYQRDVNMGMDGYNGTMPCIVDTLKTNLNFLSTAKYRISEMLKKGKYSETQRIYLRDVMFTSWFERGQKLQKNDIFDMFCVGCLDYINTKKQNSVLIDTTSYILSFDDRMKGFLGNIRPTNLRIIEKLQNA